MATLPKFDSLGRPWLGTKGGLDSLNLKVLQTIWDPFRGPEQVYRPVRNEEALAKLHKKIYGDEGTLVQYYPGTAIHDPKLIRYHPEYGYITSYHNIPKRSGSFFKRALSTIVPAATMLFAPAALSAIGVIGSGAASAAGTPAASQLSSALGAATAPATAAGTTGAGLATASNIGQFSSLLAPQFGAAAGAAAPATAITGAGLGAGLGAGGAAFLPTAVDVGLGIAAPAAGLGSAAAGGVGAGLPLSPFAALGGSGVTGGTGMLDRILELSKSPTASLIKDVGGTIYNLYASKKAEEDLKNLMSQIPTTLDPFGYGPQRSEYARQLMDLFTNPQAFLEADPRFKAMSDLGMQRLLAEQARRRRNIAGGSQAEIAAYIADLAAQRMNERVQELAQLAGAQMPIQFDPRVLASIGTAAAQAAAQRRAALGGVLGGVFDLAREYGPKLRSILGL